jgi:hypothetical protein
MRSATVRTAIAVLATLAACPISAQRRTRHDSAATDVITPGFRTDAKTTMLTGTPKVYANVAEYLRGVGRAPTAAQFRAMRASGASRTTREKRVVTLHAAIFAVLKEDDNDFHCILGDAAANGPYITAELSGLPRTGDRSAFETPRVQLKSLIGPEGVRKALTSTYYQPPDPIPVVVTGTLFYDTKHATVGPGKPVPRKSSSKWEINPVHTIVRDGALVSRRTRSTIAPSGVTHHPPRQTR